MYCIENYPSNVLEIQLIRTETQNEKKKNTIVILLTHMKHLEAQIDNLKKRSQAMVCTDCINNI